MKTVSKPLIGTFLIIFSAYFIATAAHGTPCRTAESNEVERFMRSLPEGVSSKSIDRKGNNISVVGYAKSNAGVSAVLRDIDKSPFFEKPNLRSLTKVAIEAAPTNEFQIDFSLKCLDTSKSL